MEKAIIPSSDVVVVGVGDGGGKRIRMARNGTGRDSEYLFFYFFCSSSNSVVKAIEIVFHWPQFADLIWMSCQPVESPFSGNGNERATLKLRCLFAVAA